MFLRKVAATAVSTAIACSMVAPAFAAEVETEARSSVRSQHVQVDGACMSSAVDKRDTAVIAAFDAFSAALKTALTTRKDALKAAWLLSDATERKAALRAAWKAFSASQKDARTAFRTAKKAAWKQYRADARTCKGNTSEEGNVEMTSDINL